jgi:hypothetical protein
MRYWAGNRLALHPRLQDPRCSERERQICGGGGAVGLLNPRCGPYNHQSWRRAQIRGVPAVGPRHLSPLPLMAAPG